VQQVIDGQVWSVDYGNALIDIDSIADKVVDTALEQSVDSMQLYGYSAGGDITLDLATAIQDRGIPISVIYLDSTPDGIEGLNPDRQQEVDEYATLMAKVPWLAYYDPARYVGEMALKADTFLAADSVFEAVTQFNKASEETHRLIDYEYTPGTWLLIDQLVAIEKTNGREKMQQLADNPTGVKPVIVYLGTGAPGVDTFVNDKRSGVAFCTYAAEASLPCYRYNIPGAIHMRPNLSVEAHTDVLQDAAPIIRAALDDE
jgi:acetyl esterase/lipase